MRPYRSICGEYESSGEYRNNVRYEHYATNLPQQRALPWGDFRLGLAHQALSHVCVVCAVGKRVQRLWGGLSVPKGGEVVTGGAYMETKCFADRVKKRKQGGHCPPCFLAIAPWRLTRAYTVWVRTCGQRFPRVPPFVLRADSTPLL